MLAEAGTGSPPKKSPQQRGNGQKKACLQDSRTLAHNKKKQRKSIHTRKAERAVGLKARGKKNPVNRKTQ